MKACALHGLFFFSGCAALGFQLVWSRMLAAGLGHEMPAVLAVVAAIFGGIALGAWGSGRLLGGGRRPGRLYGLLELLIGSWGIATVVVVPFCNEVALRWIGLNPSPIRHWMVAFTFPTLALLPATVAIGATFPVIERFLKPLVQGGFCAGGLYAANTLGAVTGVLASTGLIMPGIGLAQSLVVFSAISLLCGAVTLILERQFPEDKSLTLESGVQVNPPRRLRWLLALTGMLGIGYEVLGVRVLAQVLENTVYSYSAVLSMYLLGSAVGAGIYQRWAGRLNSQVTGERLLILTGMACLVGVWVLSFSSTIYELARNALGRSPGGTWAAELVVAAAVFLLPTLCMGGLFSQLLQTAQRKGETIGQAVALNTLGCTIAPAAFGVVLLPIAGAKWALIILVAGYFGLAIQRAQLVRSAIWMCAAMLLAAPAQLRFTKPAAGEKLLAYRDGIMESVAVIEHVDRHRSLLVNNRFTMGGTGAAPAERRQATIPLLLHPAPKTALFLGLGTGITFAAAGAHSSLAADGVELVPEIVALQHWFEPQNTLPARSERFRTYTADARRFSKVSTRQYDVLVADLFHPARDGAGSLYSIEHFRALRDRLAPGGLVCQWLPLFQLNDELLQVISRTFLEVFPHTRVFLLRFNVDTPVIGLIGQLEPGAYDAASFSRRAAGTELKRELESEQLRDAFHLFGCFVADSTTLREYCGTAAINTDNRPIVTFGAQRLLASREKPHRKLLDLMAKLPSDGSGLILTNSLEDVRFADELRLFVQARNAYLRGLAAEADSDQALALESFLESARISPRFLTGYAQVLTIAMREAKARPEHARQILRRLDQARPERPVARELLQRLSE